MEKDQAERLVWNWIATRPIVRDLIMDLRQLFSESKDIWLVGGAVRDCLLQLQVKDLDFVVDTSARFAKDVEKLGGKPNVFGGLNFVRAGLPIDLWSLEDTYFIKKFKMPATKESFLEGAPFNLDKVMFNVRTARMDERGFLRGISAKEIVYAPCKVYLERSHARRCVRLQKKTGFTLHKTAQDLLVRREKSLLISEH
jgi:hypothetical protein